MWVSKGGPRPPVQALIKPCDPKSPQPAAFRTVYGAFGQTIAAQKIVTKSGRGGMGESLIAGVTLKGIFASGIIFQSLWGLRKYEKAEKASDLRWKRMTYVT